MTKFSITILLALTITVGGHSAAIPSAPSGLRVQYTGGGMIHLQWNAVSGATSYQVKGFNPTTNSFSNIFPASKNSFDGGPLPLGWTYTYVVNALNHWGEGPNSGPVSITLPNPPLPAPANLTATDLGNGMVRLQWDPVAGSISYLVKGFNSITQLFSNIYPAYANWFDAGPLTPGNVYIYQVSALGSSGESPNSAQVSISMPGAPPPPPPPGPALTDSPTTLRYNVGPARAIIGPTGNMVDGFFGTINVNGMIRGYTANSTSYVMEGTSIEGLKLVTNNGSTQIALPPGPALANFVGPWSSATYGGYFDSVTKDTLEGGAWLQSAYFDGNIVRGWYHAETNTHYGAITAPNGVQYADITHKSVGYVESNDGGLTFTKPNYPSNQVLSPYTPDANTCADPMGCELGVGDMTVTRMGDYFYMFFFRVSDWTTGVARSKVTDGGKPGTWFKYNAGGFTSAGLGGPNVPIVLDSISQRASSHYTPKDMLAVLGQSVNLGGFKLSFSADAINWTALPEPLLVNPSWGNRNSESPELIMYVSLVPAQGGTDWSNSFYLTYMYSEPGSDFAHRYLVVRRVDVSTPGNAGEPQVRVALSEYLAASASGTQWATTAYTPAFNLVGSLGNIFTRQQTGMLKLVDCFNSGPGDHFVSTQRSCENRGTYLRTLGYVWDGQTGPAKTNTRQLWRCVNPTTQKHAVVSGQSCDTKPGFQAELLLGYIENP